MNDKNRLLLYIELIWWILAAALAFVIVRPSYVHFYDFPFLWANVLLVVLFVIYVRYLFFLKHTFIANSMAAKITFIVASIPLFIYLISQVHAFQVYLDNDGLDKLYAIMKGEPSQDRLHAIVKYIRNEFLLFGMGSIILIVLVPFRMLVSIWRQYNNTGKV